jgi:hypothetical protein
MRWVDALKKWNDSKDTWCIPKKGTKGYDEVMAIMMGKEEKPCPPCPKPRKARAASPKSRSPSPKPKPKPKKRAAPKKVMLDEEVDDIIGFTEPPKKTLKPLGSYAPC